MMKRRTHLEDETKFHRTILNAPNHWPLLSFLIFSLFLPQMLTHFFFFYWTKVSKWVGTFPIHEQCLYKRWGPRVNLSCFLSLCIYPTNYYGLEFEPYFIKKKFYIDQFFQVFIEFVMILLLFCALVFLLPGTWDLTSPARDRTCTPSIGRQS